LNRNINNKEFTLSTEEKNTLLKISRNTLEDLFSLQSTFSVPDLEITTNLKEKLGLFVTLHNHSELRGCLGRFQMETQLFESVKTMTISSALHDHRFRLVSKKEVPEISIEISVLTPLKKINSIEEIQLGLHGIYIKKGFHSGTFLPQVAETTGWNLEEFLGHCCRDKANMDWNDWKESDIFTYEAIVFSEK
jgi:MEMO1 family protein